MIRKLFAALPLVACFKAERPVIVASNMGRSQIVDSRGRIVARATRFFAPDVVSGAVHMPGGRTLYRRYGDWTWALPSGLALLALRRRRAAGARAAS